MDAGGIPYPRRLGITSSLPSNVTLTTALEIETGHHYDHPTTPLPIEGYSLIGDCGTAAIVRRDGATDWRIGKGAKALSATSLRLEVAF